MPMQQSSLKAALLSLSGFAVFATHDLIIKVLGEGYSPFQIVFFSALFSFPVLTLVLMRDAEPGTLRPKYPVWVAARALSGTLAALGAFYAFAHLPLAQVYPLLFATPMLITVLAIPILGETVRLRRGLAIALGMSGVLVVLRPGGEALQMGHFAALLSACAGAVNSVVARKIGGEERTVVMIIYPMMVNFVLMGIAMPFVYVPMPFEHLALMMVIAVMGMTAMVFLIMAYQRGEAMIVAPMQYSQILWAVIFGALFFDELPDFFTLLGSGIIVMSGLYILQRESDASVSENQPVSRTRTRAGLPVGLRVSMFMRLWGKKSASPALQTSKKPDQK